MAGCAYDLLTEVERDLVERLEAEADRLLGSEAPSAEDSRQLELLEAMRREILWHHRGAPSRADSSAGAVLYTSAP